MNERDATRFLSKTSIDATGCWMWSGTIAANGYGHFSIKHKPFMAHRLAFEMFNGPIPQGLVIDHLCRVRSCVNPAHLEAVSNSENLLRGVGVAAVNARKTSCKRGHPFDSENTMLIPNGRACRECSREKVRAYRARRKAVVYA